MNAAQPRVRRSITELQDAYNNGDKKPLEDLWRAWKHIQHLRHDDPKSFFTLGGYHGEPFRGAGWGSKQYWGGYCHHGNVLFPTWHRVYLYKLEKALQSVKGCEDVMLPYWDETSDDTLTHGVPWALTQEHVELDGHMIKNPLRSFRLTANIKDHISDDDADYSKPKGYETQRYPRSGLVGPKDKAKTKKHNDKFKDYKKCVTLLNDNIRDWLKGPVHIDGEPATLGLVKDKYKNCLAAPNYTVFSNTTSAAEWNDNHKPLVMSLESPHNSIHLAVGGFEVPGKPKRSPIEGANGDMGENDTAGFDPIFFFHHCFVDYVFWLWQKRHKKVEIMAEYPGTNSVDGQGATPGVAPNSWLDLDSPLYPFRHDDHRLYTSKDCLHTETQLGYTYNAGSLSKTGAAAAVAPEAAPGKIVSVSGINRAPVRGSFLVSVYGNVGKQQVHLGTEAVLSRWNVEYCANCQTHLDVTTYIEVPTSGTAPMAALSEEELADPTTYDYTVTTHDGVWTHDGGWTPSEPPPEAAAALLAEPPSAPPSPIARALLEVR
ncbi:MAG: tyrosinase family protein [Mycobacterium sp.]|uniref:tyrosinase family protein n=4 Tax=Mycobacterium sp. TaxID=1785 RepID=UPI003BEAB09B